MSSFKTKHNLNVQPILVTNYLSVQAILKKDFKFKRYKKIYNYLQIHRPESQQHLLIYYENYLKCIIKLIHSSLMKKINNYPESHQKYKQKGFQLIKKIYSQIHCQQSILEGKVKIKPKIQKHINRYWLNIIDFFLQLSIGYKVHYKFLQAIECINLANQFSEYIYKSCTSNASLLRKISRVKMQFGVLYLELNNPIKALYYLEQALNICRDQLSIRCKRKQYLKLSLKRFKQYKQCKKSILMIFIIMAYTYQSMKVFDIVSYLIKQAKKLTVQFQFEKGDGIYKTIQKLESKQFMRNYEILENQLIELSSIALKVFTEEQLQEFVEKKHHKIQNEYIFIQPNMKIEKKLFSQDKQIFCDQLPIPQKFLKQTQKQLQSIKNLNQKYLEASILIPQPSQSINSNNLTKILLEEQPTQKNKPKKKRINHKKANLNDNQQSKQRIDYFIKNRKVSETEKYMDVILENVQKKDRFKSLSQVNNNLRKFSLSMKKLENEAKFEIFKMKNKNKVKIQSQLDERQFQLIPMQDQSIKFLQYEKNKSKSKAQTPINLQFQQVIFKHRQQLKINYLFAHHNKINNDKQKQLKIETKLRKCPRKDISFKNNINLINKLHSRSSAGINKLLNELKQQVQKQQLQKQNDGNNAPRKIAKNSELFMTYFHKKAKEM